MTALDRALMKAYQRQRVGAPHANFVSPGGNTPLVDEMAAPALVANRSPASSTVTPAAVAGPSKVTQAVVAPPPLSPPTVSPAVLARSFSMMPAVVAGPPPMTSPLAVAPALELECFDWPPLVLALRETLADEWDPLLEQVLSGARTLLVTGCRRGEGRTSVALLMASMLAAEGPRVGLVDADFAKPGLAAQLGVLTSTSWTDAIAQGMPVAEAMIESLTDHVILLPLCDASEPPPSIDAAMVKVAVTALHAHCDLVCVDAGPQIDSGDAAFEAVLGAGVDAALVVRDARQSRLQQSHAVGRRLVQSGVDRWAILENFARAIHV